MQQEKASLNDISLKNTKLIREKERLCNENRNLKRDLAVQNTNLKNLEKELMLIREKSGKRPIELNETNVDNIITENIALKKVLSHSNTNEKSLNMLIKSSRRSHDKKGKVVNKIMHLLVLHRVILDCLLIFLQEHSRIHLGGKLT